MSNKKTPQSSQTFAVGDRVAYIGSKTSYSGRVGNIWKIKMDAYNVQFDDDPLLITGDVKTYLITSKDLRRISG
jgi:ribosomal protein L21E